MSVKRALMFIGAWLALGLGVAGVFVPVLPTTPFVLLASFLFANSSPRYHAWVQKTSVYQRYVRPFLEDGGITFKRKLHIIGLSFTVMAVSALVVRNPIVWLVLAAVAVFLLYLMFVRIPTATPRSKDQPVSPVGPDGGGSQTINVEPISVQTVPPDSLKD